MINAVDRVQSVTIVDRRSGPGYRLVLCRITPRGTPVLETLEDSFGTIAGAERFALDRLGVPSERIRTKLRASA